MSSADKEKAALREKNKGNEVCTLKWFLIDSVCNYFL